MVDYKIAIPSYKRAKTLRDKTLALLQKYKIPKEKIYIFVADKTEKTRYIKALYTPSYPYYYQDIIIAKRGLREARNFIQNFFDKGEYLLCLDDDIKSLKQMVNKQKATELENLDWLVQKGFEVCEKVKASLWGIYPIIDPYFMYKKITTDLRYIVGAFWGVINTHDKDTYVTMCPKEDYERTIKFYIRDGRVVRINYVGVETIYYTAKGGIQALYNKKERERVIIREIIQLTQKYPMFCSINRARKRHVEILLRDKRKRS